MRPSVPTCLALVFLLLLPTAVGAQEAQPGEVTVTGYGFGHGIGMSQHGAQSMAVKGFTADQIVRHYYTGTEVTSHAVEPLRVGLTRTADQWQLHNEADSADPLRVRLDATGDEFVDVPPGTSVQVDRVDATTCEVAVDADDTAADAPHSAACDDLRVRWPVDATTPATFVRMPRDEAHELKLARGWIDFVQSEPDVVHTVLRIGMEDYLYGLAEMPSSWKPAALQTQAMAGRTFALRRATDEPRGSSCSCDLLTTVHDQHYTGWYKESEGNVGQYGARWVTAVDATNSDDRTRGQTITYDGRLVTTYYSSSSPGTTEDPRDIWNADGAAIPWLQPVDDSYAHDGDTNNTTFSPWTRTFEYERFSERLGFDEVHEVELVDRLRSGNPGTYRVTGEFGGEPLTRELHTYRDLRSSLSLPSHGITEIDVQLPRIFDDVAVDHPFHDEIAWMVDQGLTDGYEDGTFRPGETVSRQAAAAFLYRLAGEPAGDHTTGFSDVDEGHPFHDAIAWADQEGIVEGYDDGTFGPGREVTRQAIAAFLARYEFGEDVPEGDTADFSDVDGDHPFHDEIAWMDGEGIAEGYDDGTYRPGRAVARQAAAAFLHRYEQP